jgi:anti-sigma factor RsiW
VQCAEQARVAAYFDGELDALAAAALERHLDSCGECRAQLAELGQTRLRLRQELPGYRAAPQLRARIERALDAEAGAAASSRRSPPAWRTRPFWFGAFGGLGTALAAGVAFFALAAPGMDVVLDDLVAAHVRSLMPAHLTDVVSTNQHTVKPWFAGHADVSPVVADFAPQGYPLVGGRADYFEHQRAAVVVYQHGAHLINVFSWSPGRGGFPEATTRNGYHMMFWSQGNLEYCAVSDAGWAELQALVRLMKDLGERDAPR